VAGRGEASKYLTTEPERCIRMLEQFIDNDPYDGFKAAAESELNIVRAKYRRNAT
jgi:hypothetical protein